uniref:Uncharacterized protein n=1 Tax=Arundo donax TaxID=35708 RepID=A0A0A9DWW9_ARUDO
MQPNHLEVLPRNKPRLLPTRLDILHVLGSITLPEFHDQTLPCNELSMPYHALHKTIAISIYQNL